MTMKVSATKVQLRSGNHDLQPAMPDSTMKEVPHVIACFEPSKKNVLPYGRQTGRILIDHVSNHVVTRLGVLANILHTA